MNYLEIQNLHMDYENISIDFSATLEKGKTLAIVGHSGSGKSTILRMIAGLLPSGKNAKIHLDNKDITKLPPNKRDIGMVFQSPCLFEHLKIIDNATYIIKADKECYTDGIEEHHFRIQSLSNVEMI